MAVDTKPNLSNDKFEQYSGETLSLSGSTCIFGKFVISSTGDFCMPENAGAGKVITSDANGLGSWQAISATESITKTISQSSHGFAVGDVVGWSGGTYNKAIANGSYDGEVLGIVSCCINANTFSLTQAGYVSGLTGLVTNCTYFLSDGTAGLMTTTEPTTDNHISKSVLIANSSTSGWVLPYAGYVISTGSTVISTAQNGLTDSSGIVLLGGKLIQNTVIGGDNSYDLSICNLDAFNLGFSGATITDNDITPSGLQYAANYSANYTCRSIPDVEYVNTHGAGGIGWSNALAGSTVAGCGTMASGSTALYNTYYGVSAGTKTTTTTANVAIGTYSLQCMTATYNNNTAVGYGTAMCLLSGCSNTMVGMLAYGCAIDGSDNVAVGFSAMLRNKTGLRNVAIGHTALVNICSSSYNVAIGYQSQYLNCTGCNNVSVGYNTLYTNCTGSYNIAIGGCAEAFAITNNYNIAIGACALRLNCSDSIIGIGHTSLANNTTGIYNLAIGYQTLYSNITTSYNLAIGYQALFTNKGTQNLGIGFQALNANYSGNYNTAIGAAALLANTSGSTNIAIGQNTLRYNTIGSGNIAVGNQALYCNITGSGNTVIGSCAGYYEAGSNKLYIANSNTRVPLIGGDFSSKCVTIAGALNISGATSISVTPATGSGTDSLLVWNSSDCYVKRVASFDICEILGNGQVLGRANNELTGVTIGGSIIPSISAFVITGNSTNTGFTVTHSKNTYSVMVEMMENTSPYRTVYTDISRPTTNTVCITFDIAPPTGRQYKILING